MSFALPHALLWQRMKETFGQPKVGRRVWPVVIADVSDRIPFSHSPVCHCRDATCECKSCEWIGIARRHGCEQVGVKTRVQFLDGKGYDDVTGTWNSSPLELGERCIISLSQLVGSFSELIDQVSVANVDAQ